MKPSELKKTYRIIDANLNRAKEGLRVVEEMFRFVLNDKKVSSEIKNLRHKIAKISNQLPLSLPDLKLIRQVEKDVGRNSFSKSEKTKKDLQELVMANLQRTQEALRVLEEYSKLIDAEASYEFKKLRFASYGIEKKILKSDQRSAVSGQKKI